MSSARADTAIKFFVPISATTSESMQMLVVMTRAGWFPFLSEADTQDLSFKPSDSEENCLLAKELVPHKQALKGFDTFLSILEKRTADFNVSGSN